MKIKMRKMKRIIWNLLRVNWIITLYFNFKYLPLSKAIRLPILIYGICKLKGNGIYKIADICKFGMIKLGIKNESTCTSVWGVSIVNDGTITLEGSGVLGNGSAIEVKKNANFFIGENFGITGNFTLHCHDSITIGKNFSCGWNVAIADTDFHQCYDPETKVSYHMAKKIKIGNNVWCCQNVMIAKGTTVNDWNTIAAYSLANKEYDSPPYSIIAGIPAKLVKKKIKRVDMEKITHQPVGWQITSGLDTFPGFTDMIL